MAAILNSAMFKSTILDSGILVFPLKITHTCQDWMPPFAQKKLHSFILTQLGDGSHLEFHHLEFGHFGFSHLSISSQTHSHLPRLVSHHLQKKTSLIHFDSTWWWQSSWILPSWIQPFCTKKTSFIHCDSTWWWQPSWFLPSWIQTLPSSIQTPCYLLSDSLKNTLSPLWLWLKLIQSDSNAFIPTQLDDGSNLEFFQFAFSHLSFPSQTHSHLPRLVTTICTKKLHSFILTQLVYSSDLEFCHLGFRHCHHVFRHLVYLLSDSLKNTYSTLTLTQANSIWLTWWWQPSWILPSWIQQFCTKLWLKLIHFHLNWRWQPSLILPYWI